MRKFKIITTLALVLCMVFVIAACGKSTENPGTETASAAPDGGSTAEQLIMATNAAFPPYEYKEGGKVVGIDADIAGAIAEKLGMELVIEDMEFDSIIAAVQSGKADMGMAGMTVRPDRLESVNFSNTYATGYQVVIVPEGSDILTPDDLDGKKIGVQLSTTGDIYCSDDYGDDAVERFSKGADAVQALLQGKVDAVVIDNEPAKVFVEQNTGLEILETEYAIEDYAICIAKDNDDLLDKINTALDELIADGTVQSVIDQYITAE
ncbi:MAG: transporter substrate-binding domain-containing protein [Christensenellales bacterium]